MRWRWRLAVVLLCLPFAAACASAGGGETSLTITPVGSAERLPATMMKPEGVGPFPAIVILHDCSGLGPRSSGAPDR